MERLGYKTRKSVEDLVAAGKLTPIRSKVIRGKNAPRVFFDSKQVQALEHAPNPNRLSRVQAARRLGVNPKTIDRMVTRGDLTAYPAPPRTRRRIEFEPEEIAALHKTKTASP